MRAGLKIPTHDNRNLLDLITRFEQSVIDLEKAKATYNKSLIEVARTEFECAKSGLAGLILATDFADLPDHVRHLGHLISDLNSIIPKVIESKPPLLGIILMHFAGVIAGLVIGLSIGLLI